MIPTDNENKPKRQPIRPAPVRPRGKSVPASDADDPPRELGGPSGPEPTRYGDWERKGRCIDF